MAEQEVLITKFGRGTINKGGYRRITSRKEGNCGKLLMYVTREKDKKYKQGFIWKYIYPKNGKRISIRRVNLNDLKKEVKKRGLPWKRLY